MNVNLDSWCEQLRERFRMDPSRALEVPREEDISRLGITPGPLGLFEGIINDRDGPNTTLIRTFPGQETNKEFEPVSYQPRTVEVMPSCSWCNDSEVDEGDEGDQSEETDV